MFEEFCCPRRGRIFVVLMVILLNFAVIQRIGGSPLQDVPDTEHGIVLRDAKPNDESTNNRFIPSIPADCKTDYCENALNYPSDEYIAKALNDRYIAPIDDLSIPTELTKRELRTADDQDEFCHSYKVSFYPKVAKNLNADKYLFVVNTPTYRQRVGIEMCANDVADTGCNVIKDHLPENYVSTCKQLYMQHQMVALNQTGAIEVVTFRFPSSCCCSLKYIRNSSRK